MHGVVHASDMLRPTAPTPPATDSASSTATAVSSRGGSACAAPVAAEDGSSSGTSTVCSDMAAGGTPVSSSISPEDNTSETSGSLFLNMSHQAIMAAAVERSCWRCVVLLRLSSRDRSMDLLLGFEMCFFKIFFNELLHHG